ncbi:hypothetical protein [Salisediminibacterium selenitireducens]|uniref:Uncharacterized protein n=1 Tax=Bacillus selenitireducens (strain ATCC 700615 / DSM 15326 / MLS10) TaxID=439292 RepID=D6XUQ1_BACIE|nr:hypothetical protein [Salisediminibacterium selenitireducens]ADH99537.1 hypothetical protein Bsel_2033 [[Bacillus] selenitireducens MLS10]
MSQFYGVAGFVMILVSLLLSLTNAGVPDLVYHAFIPLAFLFFALDFRQSNRMVLSFLFSMLFLLAAIAYVIRPFLT